MLGRKQLENSVRNFNIGTLLLDDGITIVKDEDGYFLIGATDNISDHLYNCIIKNSPDIEEIDTSEYNIDNEVYAEKIYEDENFEVISCKEVENEN